MRVRTYVPVYVYTTAKYTQSRVKVRMATEKAIVKAIDTACLEVKVKLKAKQRQSIEAALEGKDVFVTLPTGYGKSMIFHLLPLCARHLQLSKAPIVIVVAPLLSLVEDQLAKVNKRTGLGKAVQLKQGAVYDKLREDEG